MSTQAQDNKNSKEALVNDLFKVTKIQKMVPAMINAIINKYKTKVVNIPEAKWNEMANTINYSDFMSKSKEVYVQNYTAKEIEELIQLYTPETMATYKEKNKRVEQQLYQIGNAFGQQIIKDINLQLQNYKR
jgi:hypothetical protein